MTDWLMIQPERWEEIDAVPDGHVAIIPHGKHAGILYKETEDNGAIAVAFLWANDGTSLPGWRSNITFGQHVEHDQDNARPSEDA